MKDKYKDVPPFKPSPKEIILALFDFPEFLTILQGTKQEPDTLLDWLIGKNAETDPLVSLQTDPSISEQTDPFFFGSN